MFKTTGSFRETQVMHSMTQGLTLHTAAMGGKIYVTGGVTDSATDSVCEYDPQADAWTELAGMRALRMSHASAALGGKLYVFGGHGERGDLDTVEVYDPASDSWVQGSSFTCEREDLAAIAL